MTDEYKEAFREIYPQLIEGRYSQGDGSLMKWIQESNPNFDTSLYKDLMNSIEVERTYFAAEQKKMLDIHPSAHHLVADHSVGLVLEWKDADRIHRHFSSKAKNVCRQARITMWICSTVNSSGMIYLDISDTDSYLPGLVLQVPEGDRMVGVSGVHPVGGCFVPDGVHHDSV